MIRSAKESFVYNFLFAYARFPTRKTKFYLSVCSERAEWRGCPFFVFARAWQNPPILPFRLAITFTILFWRIKDVLILLARRLKFSICPNHSNRFVRICSNYTMVFG